VSQQAVHAQGIATGSCTHSVLLPPLPPPLLLLLLQVILCHNRLSTYKEVELALAHELVHAYDFCRASNLDLTNCNHHACTEVRGPEGWVWVWGGGTTNRVCTAPRLLPH
jgi:hypothetical protein